MRRAEPEFPHPVASAGEQGEQAFACPGQGKTFHVFQRQVGRKSACRDARKLVHDVRKASRPGIGQVAACAPHAVWLARGRQPPEVRVERGKLFRGDSLQVGLNRAMSGEVQPVDGERFLVLVESPDDAHGKTRRRGRKAADPAEKLQRRDRHSPISSRVDILLHTGVAKQVGYAEAGSTLPRAVAVGRGEGRFHAGGFEIPR